MTGRARNSRADLARQAYADPAVKARIDQDAAADRQRAASANVRKLRKLTAGADPGMDELAMDALAAASPAWSPSTRRPTPRSSGKCSPPTWHPGLPDAVSATRPAPNVQVSGPFAWDNRGMPPVWYPDPVVVPPRVPNAVPRRSVVHEPAHVGLP